MINMIKKLSPEYKESVKILENAWTKYRENIFTGYLDVKIASQFENVYQKYKEFDSKSRFIED